MDGGVEEKEGIDGKHLEKKWRRFCMPRRPEPPSACARPRSQLPDARTGAAANLGAALSIHTNKKETIIFVDACYVFNPQELQLLGNFLMVINIFFYHRRYLIFLVTLSQFSVFVCTCFLHASLNLSIPYFSISLGSSSSSIF